MGQLEIRDMPTSVQEEVMDTSMSVGEILRRTREHYGRTLVDVEKSLRIRVSQISAIENDKTEELPGRVYAIGFVRSYAEYLGLDGDKIVKLFKRQSSAKPRAQVYDFPVPASDSSMPSARVLFVAAALVVMSLCAAWYFLARGSGAADREVIPTVAEASQDELQALEHDMKTLQDSARADDADILGPPASQMLTVPQNNEAATNMLSTGNAAPVDTLTPPPPTAQGVSSVEQETVAPVAAENVSAPESAETVPASAESLSAAAVKKPAVILTTMQETRIDIRDASGNSVLSKILAAGESYYIPDRPDLRMTIGNAGGMKIEIDGRDGGTMGALGEVKSNIPLDLLFLKQHYAPQSEPVQQPVR